MAKRTRTTSKNWNKGKEEALIKQYFPDVEFTEFEMAQVRKTLKPLVDACIELGIEDDPD